MKKNLKKILLVFSSVIVMLAMPITAYADMGPKPSVQIRFSGIEGETYYGTLLSDVESTGPETAWNGREEDARRYDGTYEIWEKFVEYKDADGFYFLQRWWDCSETNELAWTYYPPQTFKILLYFPERDMFYVSPIYERYAFDSYFTVDMSDYMQKGITAEETPVAEENGIVAEKTYDYKWESISLVIRIIITILMELAIALLFGYREKKLLSFLAVVNVVTQVVLNMGLNIINYHSGSLAFLLSYVLFELIVLVIEAIVYGNLIGKFSEKQQSSSKAVLYAVTANAVSFMIGLWISYYIPGIF